MTITFGLVSILFFIIGILYAKITVERFALITGANFMLFMSFMSISKAYKLFCKHKNITFLRNVYGDEINYINARSIWVCKDCNRTIRKNELYYKNKYNIN